MLKPLAFRMRPNKIEDIIGQEHLIGKNGFLNNSIKKKFLFLLFYMVLQDVEKPL